jgi:hypothetical protein
VVDRIYAGERDRDVLLRRLSEGGYVGCGRRGGVLDLRSLVVHVLELLVSGDVAALKAWSKQDKSVVSMVWNTPNYQLFFDKNAPTFRRIVQVLRVVHLFYQYKSTSTYSPPAYYSSPSRAAPRNSRASVFFQVRYVLLCIYSNTYSI